ncbi:MAG TPA: methyltransferase domain-containing protein [Kofleriaceae bacterium]|nr:methyltransferase domain-containing protein [Kofleriaceae bacterium]
MELFRLLGDEDRLRLLALCAEEELTVGELASLIGESQPQVTKKTQPLREAGLLTARRDGTRTLLRAQIPPDVIVGAALEEGRMLCTRDGSLARVAGVVAQREEVARRFFDQAAAAEPEPAPADRELLEWLPILAPLLPHHALAIDVGTGEGTLLPLLSPLFERVVAVDRSPARLARCGARIAQWGLPNVRLREGDVEDPALVQEIADRGGADVVVMARVLRYVARPQDVVAAAARLVRGGGHVIVVDYLPHDDEALREQGDVWLGFPPDKLRAHLAGASLELVALHPLLALHPAASRAAHPPLQLAVGRKPAPPVRT